MHIALYIIFVLFQNVQLQERLSESERREQDVKEQLTSLQAQQNQVMGSEARPELGLYIGSYSKLCDIM